MADTKEQQGVEYGGRIFDGDVSYQAWGIAMRIHPKAKLDGTPQISDQDNAIRNGLAIAAQMGMNSRSNLSSTSDELLRTKLRLIKGILADV